MKRTFTFTGDEGESPIKIKIYEDVTGYVKVSITDPDNAIRGVFVNTKIYREEPSY